MDWNFCEGGNQSIIIILKKLLCNITYFKSYKTKNKKYNL
jgi:hypothetical protein